MSDSWVPLGEQEMFKDVVPLPQDDGDAPVVTIAYTERFNNVMGYFRALIQTDEKTERMLHLTEEVIAVNPANYSAWHVRREVMEHLGSSVSEELEYTELLLESNPKNYQIWHHRRLMAKKIGSGSEEFRVTAEILKEDSKNYHAWGHRQWAVKEFGTWQSELAFVATMLKEDLRNNSAWTQRYFVITQGERQILDLQTIQNEIEFALTYLKKAPNNECPWNYIKGLCIGHRYSNIEGLRNLVEKLMAQFPACPHAVALLVDIYSQGSQEDVSKAKELAMSLASNLDPLRVKYWTWIADSLKGK
eukprot:TRINITY_DN19485_c0_g1_i1.p1 TRINITY_DN19485_c0_g1~~TRINITY_DN19485_c0_g1_i1.p1  ORF type:complete len:343 (-),score=61.02 TRINITY_DN19485_c0_g1_i1:3-914(-)